MDHHIMIKLTVSGPSVVLAVLLATISCGRNAEGQVVADSGQLRSALARARPGDIIRIAPGRYQGGVFAQDLHGQPGKPIVLRAADPKQPPVFAGDAAGFHLSRVSHIELRDLTITGSTANGINIDDGGAIGSPSHHIALIGLVVRDVGPTGNRDGIKLSGVDDFRVEGVLIERWGSSGSGIDMVGCHRGEIVGSTFRGGGSEGGNAVQTKGGSSEVAIRRCRFEQAGQRAVNIGGSTGLEFFRPRDATSEARAITVEDCTFLGSDAPVAFVGVDGAMVRHNTFYRPRKWAFRVLQETVDPRFVPSRGGRFTDNIVAFRSDEMTVPINIGDGTAPDTFTLERNVWFCLDAPARSKPRLPIPETGGRYGVDPGFRDPSRGDLDVPPNSLARPAGPRDPAPAPAQP
jgi:hypothetical protein